MEKECMSGIIVKDLKGKKQIDIDPWLAEIGTSWEQMTERKKCK